MKAKFQSHEFNNVNRHDFHENDIQIAYNALVDLEDGNQVITVEICKNSSDASYLCWLVIISNRLGVKIASTSRSFVRAEAIMTAFEKAQISFDVTINWNPNRHTRFKQIAPMMEAVAHKLGVTRHTIVASGSDPL